MIRGNKRPLPSGGRIIEPEVTKVNVPITASLHNRFDIEVVDAKTGEIKQRAQAENVICTQLWTRLFTPALYWNNVHYGTGTGTPDVADTSLFNFFASLTEIASTTDISRMLPEGILSCKKKYQILESAAVGQTITEVGIAYGTAANTLCTHAMLKDMNGNQISIIKTDTDLINIYATIFVHFSPTGYDGGSIRMVCKSDAKYLSLFDWLISSSNIGDFVYALSPIGRTSSLLSSTEHSIFTKSYSPSQKTLTLVGSRLGVNKANIIGGSQCIRIASTHTFSSTIYGDKHIITLIVGDSWYPGTSIIQESIGIGDGVTKDFSTKFNYASESLIYVNAILQSEVIVENIPHKISNALLGFNLLDGVEAYGPSMVSPNHKYSPGIYTSFGGSVLAESIYENRLYLYGISSIKFRSTPYPDVYVTDDLSTDSWTKLSDPINLVTSIPTELRHSKYWKLVSLTASSGSSPNQVIDESTFDTPPPTTNIHFDVAPPEGAVITADYFTKTIAKDENHVFDLTVTIQLGEYTET